MNRSRKLLLALALLLPLTLPAAESAPADAARELAARLVIVDTHIDVPYRIQDEWQDVTRATDRGDFDLPRARRGGLDVPFMSIYTPAEMDTEGGAFQLANLLIDSVEALVARAPGQLALAYSPAEAERAVQSGRMALAMGMENGSPLEGRLENIEYFRDRGISYITLAHSLSNHLADSSYDENRQWEGLSEFGRDAVQEMNRQGVMVDISHLSDAAAFQVLEVSAVPVIASHSSARHFTPGWERNMSDELIVALAKNGGVIQINFGSSFLTAAAQAWSLEFWDERKAFREQNGYGEDDPEVDEFTANYRAEKPFPYAGLDDVLDHFDHVVKLVGIGHVGIGSDFDGVGDSLPVGLKDVADFPNLVAGLQGRGYSEADIAAILGGNLLRVWRRAVDYATQQ
jgi:membrane dipeptidase